MRPRLDGKVAIVTGAASGLGLASAVRFGEEGARVVCVDLEDEPTRAAAAEVEATGAPALAVAADVTSAESLDRAAAGALEHFGQIDVLLANAGIPGEGLAHAIELEHWERVLRVNLTGVFLSIRSVLPHMMERRGGAIVAQASLAAIAGVPGQAAYTAAKGGVVALARQLAVDYAGYGIRVNAICPATIVTPLVREAYAAREGDVDELLAERALTVPLGRLGEPLDVADLALFLASDNAGWMTGVVLPIDGGLSAAMVPAFKPAG